MPFLHDPIIQKTNQGIIAAVFAVFFCKKGQRMDLALWQAGIDVANSRNHPNGWELDFLRAMHQKSSLVTLAQSLQATTGMPVRLTSMWLDKFAWVSWVDSNGKQVNKRELADLAVIVRKPSGGKLAKWMWLVQGKRTSRLLDTYGGTSSPYEIDLFHRMPQFTLLGTGKSFDLKKNFPPITGAASPPWGAVSLPWSFMDFDADITQKSSAAQQGFSPIAPRWVGGPPVTPSSWAEQWKTNRTAPEQCVSSYTDCLVSIVTGSTLIWRDPNNSQLPCPSVTPGAPIDKQNYPIWYDLYATLLTMSARATSRHARTVTNNNGSILQASKFVLMEQMSRPSRFITKRYNKIFRESGGRFGTRILLDDLFDDGIAWKIEGALSSKALAIAYRERCSRLDELIFDEELPTPPLIPFEPPEEHTEHPGGMMVLFVDVMTDAD